MKRIYKLLSIFATISGVFWIISYPVLAHEFWIEPKKYKLNKGDVLSASLFVGQDFSGYENPYMESNFLRFEVLFQEESQKVNGRIGDRPALNIIPLRKGLSVILYQSSPTYLTYNDFQKFINFTGEKGFPEIPSQHLSLNLPKKGFKETYTRFSKSFISVQNSSGKDRYSGMELEWVMEDTDLPYNISKNIPFSLYYKGIPHPNSQVTIFTKNDAGKVEKSLARTDKNGIFTLSTVPNMSYLIDSVIIRKIEPTSNPEGAIWESLWASATLKSD